MSQSPENCTHSPEHPHPYLEMLLTMGVLWLSSVKLTVEAKPEAYYAAQDYLKDGYKPIIYSVAEHRGHTDSPIVYWAIGRRLFPKYWSNLLLVAAKDTWSEPGKQRLARLLLGENFLFERATKTLGEGRAQLEALGSRVKVSDQNIGASLVIYPQGTRDLGAPMNDLPVVLSRQTHTPLAVLNIHGAEKVFPKVPKGMERQQIIDTLKRRLNPRIQINVTVELADFIFPEDSNKKVMEQRFLKAHNVTN